MPTNLLNTPDIVLPRVVSDEIFSKVQLGSVLSVLSQAQPQKFGEHDLMTFDTRPRAEFVGESADKSPATFKFGKKTVRPYKTQVTMRFSKEVLWADEDYQLSVLRELGDAASEALGRALDLGAIHGINPLTGLPAALISDSLTSAATSKVEAGGEADIDIETAAGLVINESYRPSGIALDLSYAWKIATARFADGRKKYPDLGLGIEVSSLEKLKASVSDTVSASAEAEEATGLLGIIGDWRAFRWGVQRNVGLTRIEYGDPDGLGDLQRANEIALRAEIVYGWCWIDTDAFALIVLGND